MHRGFCFGGPSGFLSLQALSLPVTSAETLLAFPCGRHGVNSSVLRPVWMGVNAVTCVSAPPLAPDVSWLVDLLYSTQLAISKLCYILLPL